MCRVTLAEIFIGAVLGVAIAILAMVLAEYTATGVLQWPRELTVRWWREGWFR